MTKLIKAVCCIAAVCLGALHAEPPSPTLEPTLRAVDLKIGETAEVTLADGSKAKVKLLDVQEKLDSAIHPAFSPTTNIKPGVPITFKVRTFRDRGGETWDFGDGTPSVKVQSDGNAKALAKEGYAITEHAFEKAGDYIVSVEHVNERGERAIGHLWVSVGK